MNFSNIEKYFTDLEQYNSFLYLQEFILKKIEKNEPFFIGRLSGNETLFSALVYNKKNIPKQLLYQMLYNAGIKFNSQEDVEIYVREYIKGCKCCDILSIWSGGMYRQGKEMLKILGKKLYIAAQGLEPFYFINYDKYNMYSCFRNKKVLIICSHYNTIQRQIKTGNYMKVFDNKIFDSSTLLHVYKPPQQNTGLHDSNSWKHHYNIIKNDLNNIKKEFDFDIALVSCGGFGMITCNYIHDELKKSAIYIGGGLQLYFGIMGNRWNNNPTILKLKNEYWTNVLVEDIPSTLNSNPRVCENSCYW